MYIDFNRLIRFFVCYYPNRIPLGNNHYLCKGEFSTILNLCEVEKYLNFLTCKYPEKKW